MERSIPATLPEASPVSRATIPRRVLAPLWEGRTWRALAYLLLSLLLGILYFTVVVSGWVTGLGSAATLIGVPVLALTLVLTRVMARGERHLVDALLGVAIPSPYRPWSGGNLWDRVKWAVTDPGTWKDTLYLVLELPLGILWFTLSITLVGVSLGFLTLPAWYWVQPGGADLGPFRVHTLPAALALVPLGAALAIATAHALRGMGFLHGRFARILLGHPEEELQERVVELRDSRARVVAAADAERSKIERDLHDGAQQRLVTLALNLGMARSKLESDPEAARELVAEAHDEARAALEELRELARGIHPEVLTRRGLEAALEALAARSTLLVEIVATPAEPLPQPLEVAAYFTVAEALTNVAKYARANRATVSVRVEDADLAIEVRDDGVGGADPAAGSGLRGLADRLDAYDGRLEVVSPPGEGTLVRAVIPVESPRPGASRRTGS